MNLHYLLRRLLGRATCTKHPTARLDASARVFNIAGDNARISIAAHSIVKGELLVFPHGGQISIGNWCYIGEGTRLWSGASISVGDRVMISHNVNVFDNLTHPLSPTLRHRHFRHISERGHPADIDLGDAAVTIEDDAWISAGASILKGVTIGAGAIIGAGSVVTRDVPPLCIAAGNPARVIRALTTAEIVGDRAPATEHPNSPLP